MRVDLFVAKREFYSAGLGKSLDGQAIRNAERILGMRECRASRGCSEGLLDDFAGL